MPYDPELADRIRERVDGTPGLVEKKMFGGIGWTIHGNMATGAHNDGKLMIRCSPEVFESYLAEEGAEGLMRGGKPMMGWVLVDPDAVADDADLDRWVERGIAHAAKMPVKKKKATKKAKKK